MKNLILTLLAFVGSHCLASGPMTPLQLSVQLDNKIKEGFLLSRDAQVDAPMKLEYFIGGAVIRSSVLPHEMSDAIIKQFRQFFSQAPVKSAAQQSCTELIVTTEQSRADQPTSSQTWCLDAWPKSRRNKFTNWFKSQQSL